MPEKVIQRAAGRLPEERFERPGGRELVVANRISHFIFCSNEIKLESFAACRISGALSFGSRVRWL